MSAAPSMQIIHHPEQAAAALNPLRLRILEALSGRTGGSAASIAARIGLPRQQVNYHLRELEQAGFLVEVEQRRKGNCIERIVRATAMTYIISPEVMGAMGTTPAGSQDRFSSSYLISACANAIRDVAVLRRRADAVKKQLATLTVQADVRFKSAVDQNAFAEELSQAVAQLVAKYHDEDSPNARLFRCLVGAYPAITKTDEQAEQEALGANRTKPESNKLKRKGKAKWQTK